MSDGVWEVHTERGPKAAPGPGSGELRATGAAGRLTPELRAALRRDPPLLGRMTRVLLDLNFPPSLHGELCEAVGLELEEAETGLVSAKRRQRDRRMREMVLTAYEYQCAFCGYDGRIGMVPVGLEAAHIRWWAFDGPDDLENGLSLCSLHHKLFDKGVLGLGEGRGEAHRILVSQSFVGRSTAAREHVITLMRPSGHRPSVGRPPHRRRPSFLAHQPGLPRQPTSRPDRLERRPGGHANALVRGVIPRVWSLVWPRRR